MAHHFHLRKRREPYPARRLSLRVLDGIVYVVGILGPLATLPQVIEIYSTRSAGSISLFSWGTYALFDIPWILYAVAHREPPLIVCYSLWFIFNVLVVIGALLYA